MTRRRASASARNTGPASRRSAAGGLRRLVRPLVSTVWRAVRRLLSVLPGGRGLIDRVVASRIVALEAAEKARLRQAREPRFFPDRDLTGVGPDQVTPLVEEALGGAKANPQEIAAVIAEIAAASGGDVKELYRVYQINALDAFLRENGEVELPRSNTPQVSIILVLHNNAELTLPCLKSLQDERDIRVEVVIVDNASSDRTSELLQRVNGARVLRNNENVGFLLAVNQAAETARGDHLLLLNNDATMREGALSAALERLESDASIGAVGARIVLLDGRLQEAGSIIWNDGTCLGYARGDEEDAPHAMFVRDVDYCSGAFLLTPKPLWQALGGFDPVYAPAYYEEADYCMRLWAAGRRVVYEPKAVIDHFEFGSAFKSANAIAQQKKNHAVFKDRHADALTAHYAPAADSIVLARRRSRPDALRVLMVDDRIPHRRLGSGYPRAADMIDAIVAAGHELTFYPLQLPFEPWEGVYETLPDSVEAAMEWGVSGFEDYLAENIGRFDVLIVSRPLNMAFFKKIYDKRPELFSNVHIAYDAEAVFANREISKAAVAGAPIPPDRAKALIEDEVSLARPAQAIAAVCEDEARLFRSALSAPVVILGHALEPRPGDTPFARRSDLLFVGALVGEDGPNVDSVIWFTNEVLPLINQTLDRPVTLRIAGVIESEAIRGLSSPNISVLGRVDDLAELYDQSRLLVAPTRYAAGVPRKVHEAAAHGLPSVVTELIARQLGWADGEAVLVGRDAETFAAQVVRLYQDERLWIDIRRGALHKLEDDCSPAAFDAALSRLLMPNEIRA
jgi:GT2 family glycosyltransferase/glycosyltransferase involved in cell wall biosynthesis